LQVASKCKRRGLLVRDDGKAHTPESLAAKTRAKPAWFERALPFFVKLGWLKMSAVGRQLDSRTSAVPTGCRDAADAVPAVCRIRSTEEEKSFSSLSLGGRVRSGRHAARQQQNKTAEPAASAPPDRGVVLEHAHDLGIERAAAESFFDHFEASGWVDAKGRPLASWQARLRRWWRDWQERAKVPHRRPGPPSAGKPKPSVTMAKPAPVPKTLGDLMAEKPEVAQLARNAVAEMRKAVNSA
jgi:hypothetical protein